MLWGEVVALRPSIRPALQACAAHVLVLARAVGDIQTGEPEVRAHLEHRLSGAVQARRARREVARTELLAHEQEFAISAVPRKNARVAGADKNSAPLALIDRHVGAHVEHVDADVDALFDHELVAIHAPGGLDDGLRLPLAHHVLASVYLRSMLPRISTLGGRLLRLLLLLLLGRRRALTGPHGYLHLETLKLAHFFIIKGVDLEKDFVKIQFHPENKEIPNDQRLGSS